MEPVRFPEDIPGILAIERASFSEDAYPEELFYYYVEQTKTIFLVARAGRRPTGYVIARRDRWGAEIISLAVLPRARKRGIGEKLLTAVIHRFRRQDVRTIRLMVRVDNAAAIALYRQLGFHPAGHVTGYYEDGSAALKMRRVEP